MAYPPHSRQNGNGTKKYSEKSDISKETKKITNINEKRTHTVVKKQNKRNDTQEKDNTIFVWRIHVRATCG